jgi:hypothetical protein
VPSPLPLNLMVASTVYHFEDQLAQLCGVLSGFGFKVWNSRASFSSRSLKSTPPTICLSQRRPSETRCRIAVTPTEGLVLANTPRHSTAE